MADLAFEREAIALFEAILALPEAARDAWLAARTVDRPDLRARIDAMRAADRAASLRTGGAVDDLVEAPAPAERLGGYRLLDRIGRGGMGAVYRAERDLGDFAHVAAIKIIKPGLLSEALVERFRRERQTLAGLSHPNIARLFGGGETADGAPYIIMELVDGLPLPLWIDARAPSLAERLTLFREACGAVAFAHANLVAHRDVTPSNIIVTVDGHAKLIDFGIARPLDEMAGAAEGASRSLTGLALTPGYSAPERQRGEAISTAADIYSLGRVLNRLLGESTPPELAAIVARATAPLPEDRYATVEALADDVAAFAAGEPVAGFAGGRWYVLRKFVGRHRLAVGSAVLGLLLLVGALGAAVNGYVRAETARRAEAARFDELRRLAGFMIFDLDARLQRVAGNAEARLALVDRAQHYLAALAASADASPALRHEAGRGFVALAEVQGVPGQANLGQVDAARANLKRGMTLLRADLPPAAAAPDLARALVASAMVSGHLDADSGAAGRALAEAEALLGAVPPAARGDAWQATRSEVRRAQLDIAILDQKPPELHRLADILDAEAEAWPATRAGQAATAFDHAAADYHRGVAGYYTDDLTDAVAAFTRAEVRLVALDRARPNDPRVLYLLAWNDYTGYGSALDTDQANAARFLGEAQRTIDRLLAIEPNDSALQAFAGNIGMARAQMLSAEGQHAAAIAAQHAVIALFDTMVRASGRAATKNRLVIAHLTLGNIAVRAGDRALACSAYATARAHLDALRRDRLLLPFVAHFAAGLTANDGKCRAGASLGALKDLT